MTFVPAELESALARLDALPDATARAAARQAVSAILELHGEGLRRLSERFRESNPDGDRRLEAIAQDELVASLFVLHRIHPLSLETRVRRALARGQATHDGATGGMDIVSIDDVGVRLRVDGNDRLRHMVARAVLEAAPDLERIEVLDPEPNFIPLRNVLGRRNTSHERCDLCGYELSTEHGHLFDVARRRLDCACAACSVLFDSTTGKMRRVRNHAVRLEDFRISAAQWQALEVPVALAFFSYSSSLGQVVAAYPGPAGAVESLVSETAWQALVEDNTTLAAIDADIAALLVDRLSAQPSYYVLSIDECYRLTGLVRNRWEGVTGGDGPKQAVREFFETLSGSGRS